MSRFFSEKFEKLTPYTPGEQPGNMKYIKLNTNESPYPPSEKGRKLAAEEMKKLQLYSDPESRDLIKEGARVFGVKEDEILFTNGSDEVLNFAFMAFCDAKTPAIFPDITYGFYKVFAQLNGVPYREIPLKEDFTVPVEDFLGQKSTVFLANPNAPTGLFLKVSEIERILQENPENVVVIDEAYVDFGGESVIPLIRKYDNLLVTGTFSKSRSLAGGRLGFGIASSGLIRDLNTMKFSTNPYNVNRMTMAFGVGTLQDEDYVKKNCEEIRKTRKWVSEKMKDMGFSMTDSKANFIFARHQKAEGKKIYLGLKEKGVLVRHFDTPRLSHYNRITVGSREEMEIFLEKLEEVLEDLK